MNKLLVLSVSVLSAFSSFAGKISTEEYIDTWKVTAIEQMNEFAIPASITLAQGILESGNGNSRLAQNANNHFGIKCHRNWDGGKFYQDDDLKNECFRSYDNAAQSYDDHSLFLTSRSRYDKLFEYKITDYKSWAKGLKSAGYATNPKYAKLLIDIIEKYELYEYDKRPDLPAKENLEELSTKPDDESPVNVITETPTAEKDESVSLAFGQHQVKRNKYDIRYFEVKKGDTYYRIAEEFELGMWQLYRYNDLGKRDVLREGEIIYLDPKRSRSKRGYNVFVCSRETSLRQISQEEGIKLKKLLKYNFSNRPDEALPAGTKVILR
ncbi:MAG: glucosaminidase domain-containing protein [Flavobacteriales bacterium]|nr:glucosaminidase domain-containing protein [Flavobacteriales bacterium]